MTGVWLASYAILWVLVLGEAFVILALARQIGVLHRRLAPAGARMTNVGLELGEVAPRFSESDLNGRLVTLGVERSKPTMLIFISAGCSVCAELAPSIRSLYRHEKVETIVVSMTDDQDENRVYAKDHKLDRVPYIVAPHIAVSYQVTATPYAMLIDAEGKVYTKGLVNNGEHLESLLTALDERHASFDSKMNALVAAEEHPS